MEREREDRQSEGGREAERGGGRRERERGREKVVEVEGYIWRETI